MSFETSCGQYDAGFEPTTETSPPVVRPVTQRDLELIGPKYDPDADPATMIALANRVQAEIDLYRRPPD